MSRRPPQKSSRTNSTPPQQGRGHGPTGKNRSAETSRKDRPRFSGPSQSRPHSAGAAESVSIPKSWRMIAGHHAMKEAFNVRPKSVRELWLKSGYESSQELRDFEKYAKDNGIKIQIKSPLALDKVCSSHQGAVLLKEGRPEWDESNSMDVATYLLLDGIEDPHNLGAILRTSWLMGVQGIFIPENRAVQLTPTVHKVACGGAEHVPVESFVNLSQPVEKLKEQGFWVFGLSHKAEKTIFDFEIPQKIVWAVGSEEKGLRSTTERLCDELVSIPQLSNAASYNASVATAIALTETFRQHRPFQK
jgi:23S rRNA (guanosine2251-2'-O)-methyltransferase